MIVYTAIYNKIKHFCKFINNLKKINNNVKKKKYISKAYIIREKRCYRNIWSHKEKKMEYKIIIYNSK